MKHIATSLLVGISVLCVGCGTHEVRYDPNNQLLGRGAEYYLPRTVLVAKVPVVKTVKQAGRFHYFSVPLLQMEPLLRTKQDITFKLGKEIALETAGERDEQQKFVSLHKKGPFQTFTQSYKFSEDGVLTHGEAKVENKTVEFVVSTIEAVSKFAKAAAASQAPAVVPLGLQDLVAYLALLPGGNTLTPELLAFGLQIEMANNPVRELQNQQADPNAAAWKAFMQGGSRAYNEVAAAASAAKKVVSLSGAWERATTDAGRDKIQEDLQGTLASFIGSSEEITWMGTLRYVPRSRSDQKTQGSISVAVELVVLNSRTGPSFPGAIVDVRPSARFMDISYNEPEGDAERLVHSRLGDPDTTSSTTKVTLSSTSTIPSSTPGWTAQQHNGQKHGWHYRVPALATVRITSNADDVLIKRMQIAQHGCVAFLPATSGGQTFISNIELDPATGALKVLSHGGVAFDPGLINRVGDAVTP